VIGLSSEQKHLGYQTAKASETDWEKKKANHQFDRERAFIGRAVFELD
jgi:hypothetical protein